MKLNVDKEADALYLRLDDSPIVESEEVSPGVVLDYNASNEVVGVEIAPTVETLIHTESFYVAVRVGLIALACHRNCSGVSRALNVGRAISRFRPSVNR